MNNHERAGRIWDDLSGRAGCGIDSWEPAIKTECLDMIAAQIDEAVEEAKAEDYAAGAIEQQKRCRAHKVEAYEDAAKIAEENECGEYCCSDLVFKVSTKIRARKDEAVRDAHRDIAAKQALIHGEAVMLGGKLVANEELYKQPTDYVKEAFAEGYAAAREQAAGIANSFEPDQCTRAYAEGYNDAIDDASRAIRAMVPPGEVDK